MDTFRCAHCGATHPLGIVVKATVVEQVEAKPPEDPEVRAWVKRIAELSTRKHEFGPEGEFMGWVNPRPF